MKRKTLSLRWLSSFWLGLLFVGASSAAYAQENFVIGKFNTMLDIVSAADGGGDSKILDWSSEDAEGNPNSGSLSVTIEWTSTPNSWHDSKVNFPDPAPWPGLNVSPYVNVEFDVKVVQGSSTPATDGSYGLMQVVCQGWDGAGNNMGVSWVPLAIVQIEARDGWQHISVPLLAFANNNLNQLVLNFAGNPPSATVGTIVYLVDNLELTVPAGPAPTLSLEKPPHTGLNLFTTDNVYGRQNIRTVATNLTWVGASAPVTYSLTVAAFPVSSVYSNFQAHMLLVADPPAAAGQSDPDWNATNVVRLDIGNNADGSGYASFRFKTNAPGSNGTYYDVGTLGNVGSSTVVGTWSVTFDQDTNVTLTSPDGTTTQLVFPAEAVPFFNTPNLRVYFGAMPNNAPNIGQAAVLGGAAISGAGGGVADDFSGSQLDPQKWEVSAILPANVVQVPADAAFWLSWTLPDNQYVLRATTNLADPNSWADLPLPASTYGGKRRVIIPVGQPGVSQGYFQLVKPAGQ